MAEDAAARAAAERAARRQAERDQRARTGKPAAVIGREPANNRRGSRQS